MKIKNISGSTFSFALGARHFELANNATATVEDTIEAINDAMRYAEQNKLQVTVPPRVATYTGGADLPGYLLIKAAGLTDGDTVTLGGVTFEFDVDNDGVTAGNTEVDGATDSAAMNNLKTAINADATLAAAGFIATDRVNDGTNEVLVVRAVGTTAIADIDEAQTGGNVAFVTVADADPVGRRQVVIKQAVTAGDVTDDAVLLVTGLTTVEEFYLVVRNASAVEQAYDGVPVIGGGTVMVPVTAVTTPAQDLIATDVLFLVAWGN